MGVTSMNFNVLILSKLKIAVLHHETCFFSSFEVILWTSILNFYRNMKKTFLFILLLLSAQQLLADTNSHPIVLEHKDSPRSGVQMYYDMPAAYYEYDIKTQEITIDGNGSVSYYDVEISSPVTNTVEISTQVDGDYDTFSISSLPAGTHVITIESPSGNIFEGTFTL